MSPSLPEDVHREITKAVMAFGKGKQGEERDSLRKLRDSTLLNLSMTSRDVSSVSLPALYRNVTVTPFNSSRLLPYTRILPNRFIYTRSLRLGLSQLPEDSLGEMQLKHLKNEDKADHPYLKELNEPIRKIVKQILELLNQEKSVPAALEKKRTFLLGCRSASIISFIVESMPHLQLLESYNWTIFHFVKTESIPSSGARFSRPLSGLSNLRVLKIGKSDLSEVNAANCVWLLLFLPRLTHLKVYVEFCFSDEKFFRDHQEVLVGKSQVTHLEIEFRMLTDQRTPTSSMVILEKLLNATKGLLELKLRSISPLEGDGLIFEVSSLLFLRSLKSSFNSLKYLCLIGNFTERSEIPEAEVQQMEPPSSVNLKSLEMITFDVLSTGTLRRIEENSKISLKFPSLRTSHFHACPEDLLLEWIKSKSFPNSVKKIVLDEVGRVMNFGGSRNKWENKRAELVSFCKKRGLEVKILKEGESAPIRSDARAGRCLRNVRLELRVLLEDEKGKRRRRNKGGGLSDEVISKLELEK